MAQILSTIVATPGTDSDLDLLVSPTLSPAYRRAAVLLSIYRSHLDYLSQR